MSERRRFTDEELLRQLRQLADDLGYVPAQGEVDESDIPSVRTYYNRFSAITVAIAKAGLIPHSWNLLSKREISEWNQTAVSQSTDYALAGVFFQFLPVNVPVYVDFEPEWLITLAEDIILRIPSGYTSQNEDLEIRVPETWTDPHTDQEEETKLPELLEWSVQEHGSTNHGSGESIKYVFANISDEIDFETERPEEHHFGAPRVTFTDLYHTHGVHLARNGASTEWIARRMGLNEPELAEAYYAILEHHDQY